MKNLANYISISRIVMSIILLFTKVSTLTFLIIYIYCGISDMVDGYIARKSKTVSEIGSRIDSIADLIFLIIVLIKIFPSIIIPKEIIIWAIIIFVIKVYNAIRSYIYNKKIILPHTPGNRITGLLLFISVLILLNNNCIILEIIICISATYSAVEEKIKI